MCELYVRVQDKGQTNPYLAWANCQANDVVTIQEDGYAWSAIMLGSAQHIVVKVPGVTIDECLGFLAPELPPVDEPDKFCWIRNYYLDLPAITGTSQQVAPGTLTLSYNSIELNSYRIPKPPYPDPRVL